MNLFSFFLPHSCALLTVWKCIFLYSCSSYKFTSNTFFWTFKFFCPFVCPYVSVSFVYWVSVFYSDVLKKMIRLVILLNIYCSLMCGNAYESGSATIYIDQLIHRGTTHIYDLPLLSLYLYFMALFFFLSRHTKIMVTTINEI